MTAPLPRLLVNADDLGLCPSVNTAIFEVFRAGNLSSATLMVGMPGTDDAISRLAEHPGLGVGLHFNLSEGVAAAGPSGCTDSAGRFLGRARLATDLLRGRIDARVIRRELEAQLRLAERGGARLTHVDSHQHVMMLPPVFDAVLPLLRERRLPVRLVRPPLASLRSAARRPAKLAKQVLNLGLAMWNGRRHALGNARLVSVHDLDSPGPYDAGTYQRLVAAASPPSGAGVLEVMVHPYRLGPDLLALYAAELHSKMPFLRRCAAEHAALSTERVFPHHQLIHFGQLVSVTAAASPRP